MLELVLETADTRSLIAAEARRLHVYRIIALKHPDNQWGLDLLVCYPGQEPTTHPQWSFQRTMGTVIKSGNIVWADGNIRRPFVGSELMCTQGIVASKVFKTNFNFESSFLVPRERSFRAMSDQAGNALPVPAIGLAFLWLAGSVRCKESEQIPCTMRNLWSLSGYTIDSDESGNHD